MSSSQTDGRKKKDEDDMKKYVSLKKIIYVTLAVTVSLSSLLANAEDDLVKEWLNNGSRNEDRAIIEKIKTTLQPFLLQEPGFNFSNIQRLSEGGPPDGYGIGENGNTCHTPSWVVAGSKLICKVTNKYCDSGQFASPPVGTPHVVDIWSSTCQLRNTH